ncbi:hypothetical protein [Ruegeria sp. HKCCD7255]|uniref:hypothetical protein n=1 Tax=Ruegeria sp. HKCCD7255 TaxID=2683004 RepID=UPI001489DB77|nr:hypothetical protein [Ruegeria sp. HKCCD7255]
MTPILLPRDKRTLRFAVPIDDFQDRRRDRFARVLQPAKTKVGWSEEKPAKLEEEILSIFDQLKRSAKTAAPLRTPASPMQKTIVEVVSTIEGFLE